MTRRHNQGFSLIESLITLLVLSIGMLGLGQLQARLWVSAGDLYNLDKARLLATNIIELAEINRSITAEANTSTEFRYEVISASTTATTTNAVQVVWERPSGSDATGLDSTVYTLFLPADARWLAPAGVTIARQ